MEALNSQSFYDREELEKEMDEEEEKRDGEEVEEKDDEEEKGVDEEKKKEDDDDEDDDDEDEEKEEEFVYDDEDIQLQDFGYFQVCFLFCPLAYSNFCSWRIKLNYYVRGHVLFHYYTDVSSICFGFIDLEIVVI